MNVIFNYKFIKIIILEFYKPVTLAFAISFIFLRGASAVDCCINSFVPGEICYQNTTDGPKILSTGFAEISFDHHGEILDASMEATMEAKAHLSEYFNQTFKSLSPGQSLRVPNAIERSGWTCLLKKPFNGKTIRLEAYFAGVTKICECHRKGTGIFTSVAVSPRTVATVRAVLQAIYDGSMAFDKGNYASAYRLWRPVAEKGIPDIQVRFGELFEAGKGVPQNAAVAAKWYLAAAKFGFAAAQFKLWRMYFLGLGVPQNYAVGAKWLQNSAKQGYLEAEYRLAKSYHTGTGLPQDFDEAIKWYLSAARQGNAKAHYNLGMMFHKGEGVELDPIQAYVRLNVAVKLGIGRANRVLNQLKAILPDEQIVKAEQRSRQLMAGGKQ